MERKLLKSPASWIVLTAQVISLLYAPFYLPVVAFVVLFLFSYLNLLPFSFKAYITFLVFLLTVVAPRGAIRLYCATMGWKHRQLGRRERRFVPYVISILCYGVLYYTLVRIHMPRFTLGVVAGALVIQLVCALINIKIKISTHAAASGGVVGALMAFALKFSFDPTGWLCITVILCGMVCSARLILRQHSLKELGWGVLVGVLCGFLSILLV